MAQAIHSNDDTTALHQSKQAADVPIGVVTGSPMQNYPQLPHGVTMDPHNGDYIKSQPVHPGAYFGMIIIFISAAFVTWSAIQYEMSLLALVAFMIVFYVVLISIMGWSHSYDLVLSPSQSTITITRGKPFFFCIRKTSVIQLVDLGEISIKFPCTKPNQAVLIFTKKDGSRVFAGHNVGIFTFDTHELDIEGRFWQTVIGTLGYQCTYDGARAQVCNEFVLV